MLRLSCPHVAVSLLLIAAIGLCVGSHSAAFAQAPTYYTVTEIQPFNQDPRTTSLNAAAINTSGQVVGATSMPRPNNQYHSTAYMWQNGVMTDIGATMEGPSYAYDVNDSGQAVGYFINPNFQGIRAVWWHDGIYTDLHPILVESGLFSSLLPSSFLQTRAISINNAGQIMGDVSNTRNETLGFIYHNGVVTVIPRPGVATWPQHLSMNNLGQVTGYFPVDQAGTSAKSFVWHDGVMSILTQPDSWRNSNAIDINDVGQIVGSLNTGAGPDRGFIYADGEFGDLGLAYPNAINNSGVIVGIFLTGDQNRPRHGFIYSGAQMRDVNELVPASFSASSPFQIDYCGRISEQGQLLCQGEVRAWINGFGYKHISRHVVLTPVLDMVAPQIHSYDFGADATSAEGAVVHYGFSITDDFDRQPTVTYSHPSGTFFPVGTTTVTATARDASGNQSARTFQITVVDQPPVVTVPEPIFTDATSASGAVVNYVASAHDIIDGDREITCAPASGSIFPIGETAVTCTSTDAQGHTATGEFQVFVLASGQEATPTGYDVPVQSSNGALSLTFAYVGEPGVTTVAPIDAASIGTTPSGFAVSDVAYEIHTTSEGATDNGVQLAFVVPNAAGMSEEEFNSLRVLHNNNGTLEDVTYYHDFASRTIYAYTYSFSPFYLGKALPQRIETLYDRATAYKAGSTIPVKIRVRDNDTNANQSSSTLAVTARSVKRLSGGTALAVTDAGAANPDGNFRYLGERDGGSYIFNLSTKGLQAGRYSLSFYVGADRSFFHTVEFEVK